MAQYSSATTPASRLALKHARRRVGARPPRLALEALRMAAHVYRGDADFAEVWNGLWLTATSAGVPHLDAQETIGRAFSRARAEAEVRGATAVTDAPTEDTRPALRAP